MNIFEKEKFQRVQTLEKEQVRRAILKKQAEKLFDESVPLTFIKRCQQALKLFEEDNYMLCYMSLGTLDACAELQNKLDKCVNTPLTFRMVYRLGMDLRHIGQQTFWGALEGHHHGYGMSIYSMFILDNKAA